MSTEKTSAPIVLSDDMPLHIVDGGQLPRFWSVGIGAGQIVVNYRGEQLNLSFDVIRRDLAEPHQSDPDGFPVTTAIAPAGLQVDLPAVAFLVERYRAASSERSAAWLRVLTCESELEAAQRKQDESSSTARALREALRVLHSDMDEPAFEQALQACANALEAS